MACIRCIDLQVRHYRPNRSLKPVSKVVNDDDQAKSEHYFNTFLDSRRDWLRTVNDIRRFGRFRNHNSAGPDRDNCLVDITAIRVLACGYTDVTANHGSANPHADA